MDSPQLALQSQRDQKKTHSVVECYLGWHYCICVYLFMCCFFLKIVMKKVFLGKQITNE